MANAFTPDSNIFAPGTISPTPSTSDAVNMGLSLRRNWDYHTAMEAEIEDRKYTREMAAKGQRLRFLMDAVKSAPEGQGQDYADQLHTELTGQPPPQPFQSPEEEKAFKAQVGVADSDITAAQKGMQKGDVSQNDYGDKVAMHSRILVRMRDPSASGYDPATGQVTPGGAAAEAAAQPKNPSEAEGMRMVREGTSRMRNSWAGSPGYEAGQIEAQQGGGIPTRDIARSQAATNQYEAETGRQNANTFSENSAENRRRSQEASDYEALPNMPPGARSRAAHNIAVARFGGEKAPVWNDSGDAATDQQDAQNYEKFLTDRAAAGMMPARTPEEQAARTTRLSEIEAGRAGNERRWAVQHPGVPADQNPYSQGNVVFSVGNIQEAKDEAAASAATMAQRTKQLLDQESRPREREFLQDQYDALTLGRTPKQGLLHGVVTGWHQIHDFFFGEPDSVSPTSISKTAGNILDDAANSDRPDATTNALIQLQYGRSLTEAQYGPTAALEWDRYINSLPVASAEAGANRERQAGAAAAAAQTAKDAAAAEHQRNVDIVARVKEMNAERDRQTKNDQRNRELDIAQQRADTGRIRATRDLNKSTRQVTGAMTEAETRRTQREAAQDEERRQREDVEAWNAAQSRVEKGRKADDTAYGGDQFSLNPGKIGEAARQRVEQAKAFNDLISTNQGRARADRLFNRNQQADMIQTYHDYAQAAASDDPNAMRNFFDAQSQSAAAQTGPQANETTAPSVDQQATAIAQKLYDSSPDLQQRYAQAKESLAGKGKDLSMDDYLAMIARQLKAQGKVPTGGQ